MRTIYLHIGRGKTGTTTIQRLLSHHRSALLKRNIHYVRAGGGAKGIGHQDFGKSFIRELPGYMVPPRRPEAARRRIAAEITRSKASTIVISSENLELAEAGEVARFFDTLPVRWEVRVIFFVRSQDELVESEYNQLVKMRRVTKPISEYIDHELMGYDFMETASHWEAAFGRERLMCRVCDCSTNDAVGQFLSCLPGSEDLGALLVENRVGSSNMSIGFKALTVARLLNAVDISNRAWLYDRVFAELAHDDLPALFFDSQEARAFRDRFAESNRAFTTRYMDVPRSDLGGRRLSDRQRDDIRARIKALRLDSA